MAKMKMTQYEGSAADMAVDHRKAKKRGISFSKWEGSKADLALDKKAIKRKKKK